MKRRTITLIVIVFVIVCVSSCAAYDGSDKTLTESDTVDSEVNNLTFEEMVNEIAEKTRRSADSVTMEFVSKEIEELKKEEKKPTYYDTSEVIKSLNAKSYISVYAGGFPTFYDVYKPKGLTFYGEGETDDQGHTAVAKILNVYFDQTNSLPGKSDVKQFNGNVFFNLENENTIYYSVDGNFYNNGWTTSNTSVNNGVSESGSVYLRVTNPIDYFDYMNHNGRWNG